MARSKANPYRGSISSIDLTDAGNRDMPETSGDIPSSLRVSAVELTIPSITVRSTTERVKDDHHDQRKRNGIVSHTSTAQNCKVPKPHDAPKCKTHIPETHSHRTKPKEDDQTSVDTLFSNEKQDTCQDVRIEYPQGVRLWLIVLALCLSIFVMALDNSIISTAIPSITDEFRSLSDVGWYGGSYLLATAALQLFFGRLYTFFSIKAVFLSTVTIFEIGSLVCGVAQSSLVLIVGRTVAGVGSAGIFAGAMVCLAHSVPLEKRPMYHGWIGSMWGVAAVAGPLLGGIFTDKINWRLCFLINLPLGAFTLAIISLYFHDPPREVTSVPPLRRLAQLDPIGTVLFIPAVICLFLALQWGGTARPWNDRTIIALLVLSAALLLGFVLVQYHQQDDATVPPRIICRRTVWAACFFAFNTGAAYLLGVYFLPIWFQAVKGASAVGSGLLVVPLLVSVALLSVAAGSMVSRFGYYAPFMLVGSVLATLGFALLRILDPSTNYASTVLFQTIAGSGIGLGLQQPLMAVQTVLPLHDVPIGTAAVMFTQTMGAALAVALGQAVFANHLVAGIVALVPGLSPSIVLEIGATSIQSGGQGQIPPELLPDVTRVYNDALAQTFIVSAVTAGLSVFGAAMIEWKSVKGRIMGGV